MRASILPSLLILAVSACTTTDHPEEPATLGTPKRSADLLAVIDLPGPIEVETVASADWKVDRGGLINLKHPKAVEAQFPQLKGEPEPIKLLFHTLRHPEKGTFIIDSGIERALRDAPDSSLLRGWVGKLAHLDWLMPRMPLGDWIEAHGAAAGVLLTHLHIDHVLGLRDLPAETPIYAGPGETRSRRAMNLATRGVITEALSGKKPIQAWQYRPDTDERFEGVIDLLGDGSLWALWVPGHTVGSTAYLARTPDGPVLFVGDTCHTRWGWDNGVEPGSFTEDHDRNVDSLGRLKRLTEEHHAIRVRPGHQL